MYTLIWMILWMCGMTLGMLESVGRHFIVNARFEGEVATTVEDQWPCDSLLCCAFKCLSHSECEGFCFDGTTCFVLGIWMTALTQTTPKSLARYYENKGAFGKNLAAGKPSLQNGLYDGHGIQGSYTADQANDGSRESEPNGPSGSCSHLGYTVTPQTMWWQVDLEAVYRVTSLALLPRKDAIPSEFENIKASVGLTHDGNFTDCVTDTGPGFYGEMRSYTCPVSIVGQFVKISKNCTGWTFTLCEVEVYGEPV